MPTHTCSYSPRRRACGEQTVVVYIRLQNTIGSVLACIAQGGGALVSPEVLARLSSSIAYTKALVHAPVPLLAIVRYEARAAIERRWCIYGLNTPPVVYQACIKYTTGGAIRITLCSCFIYDCQFHTYYFPSSRNIGSGVFIT